MPEITEKTIQDMAKTLEGYSTLDLTELIRKVDEGKLSFSDFFPEEN